VQHFLFTVQHRLINVVGHPCKQDAYTGPTVRIALYLANLPTSCTWNYCMWHAERHEIMVGACAILQHVPHRPYWFFTRQSTLAGAPVDYWFMYTDRCLAWFLLQNKSTAKWLRGRCRAMLDCIMIGDQTDKSAFNSRQQPSHQCKASWYDCVYEPLICAVPVASRRDPACMWAPSDSWEQSTVEYPGLVASNPKRF
jgi:hypothetical protein